jgi:hypothetical protein
MAAKEAGMVYGMKSSGDCRDAVDGGLDLATVRAWLAQAQARFVRRQA